MRRLVRLRVALAVVFGLGAAALAWDVVSDDGPSVEGDRFERIDAYVADQMGDSRVPGAAIAVVERGAIVHAAGFGDDGRGNAVTADTPFWIGSNTKSITALATMQLVEAGEVRLDDPVQRYLPEFTLADPDAAARITVRHLLNQTSGLSRRDGLRAVVAAEDQSVAEAVADMADLRTNRAVGESFEYANLNSVVLGLLVERVSGQPWPAYVQANIFDPLGMDRTFTDPEAARQNGLTATHRSWFGFPVRTDGNHLEGLAPSGYVYSTANDLARYLAMYNGGGTVDGVRVLSDAGIAAMLAPATNQRTFPLQSQQFTARYGAGWFVGPFGVADGARWHQGSLPHFSSWMVLLPDSDQAVVVLLNSGSQFEIAGANAAWSRIPVGVVDLLRNEEPPTGAGATRFFVVFDTLVAAAVVAQGWSLARVIGAPDRRRLRTWRNAAPLLWEVLGAGLLVLAYPGVTGGLGWRAALTFVPDLTLSVLAICALALATGAVRIVHFLSRGAAPQPVGAPSRDGDEPSRPASRLATTGS